MCSVSYSMCVWWLYCKQNLPSDINKVTWTWTDIFVLNIREGAQGGNVHTSIMKSVYGFKLSCWSCPLTRSCLYLTRKWPRFFSSLDSFSRRSSFSTSSWLRNRAARIVMGLGELSWALCQTRFISPTLPSAGRPAGKHTANQNINMFWSYKISHLKNTYI